jgi:hypothetical protein
MCSWLVVCIVAWYIYIYIYIYMLLDVFVAHLAAAASRQPTRAPLVSVGAASPPPGIGVQHVGGHQATPIVQGMRLEVSQ